MTDCSSNHGSTSSSSDIMSPQDDVLSPRIRVIRLVRPPAKRSLLGTKSTPSFGFAIRGGKEFSTGFFVARVEKGSEADIKGLRVGDQIIRVNGFSVEDTVHKELSQFIASQNKLTLKVRGVGIVPVKEKPNDPLTWMICTYRAVSSFGESDDMASKDVRIVMNAPPKTKLGLGLCKGPEWKPGIFVQFTKEYGIARDAGLRPGDQILSCNGFDFTDIIFSEAVAVMKDSQILDMIVRSGAGAELFPGESSGYNSSASSVTGDQSPCWGDQASKRLSSVKEEHSNSRLDLHARFWNDTDNYSHHIEQPRRISSDQSDNLSWNGENNKTIIHLTDKGTIINNTLIPNTSSSVTLSDDIDNASSFHTPSQFSNDREDDLDSDNFSDNIPEPPNFGTLSSNIFAPKQSEVKTVVVEVHRTPLEEKKECPSYGSSSIISGPQNITNAINTSVTLKNASNNSGPPAPPPKPPKFPSSSSSVDENERCSSAASFSSCGTTSLSSAISEELKKRQERRCNQPKPSAVDYENLETNLKQQPKRMGNPLLGGNGDDKRHSALMDEFKRAHRKMFKKNAESADEIEDDCEERQQELSKTTIFRDEVDHVASNGHTNTDLHSFPPPPPPPQFANSPPKPLKANTLRRFNDTPKVPTPDYDTTPTHTLPKLRSVSQSGFMNGTLRRVAASDTKTNGDAAELESLESFKLTDPSSPVPRPPSLYFAAQSSGPPTMKKLGKSVSVTISEYGGAQNGRKEPSKFAFISKANGENGHSPHQKDENVTDMLRSELEKTLSRSNLRKRNEAQNTVVSQESTNGFHENGKTNGHTNGNSSIPAPPPFKPENHSNGPMNNKPVLQKALSSNIEKLTSMLQSRQLLIESNNNNRTDTMKSSNKVTISIPNKQELRKTESSPVTPTNGILKNGFSKSNYGEKSISFGN